MKPVEKLAGTERNLDESKGQMYRADDNTDEIRKLNRSIFIPAITINKEKKRLAQEKRREMRFMEEQEERQLAMQDIRETQNRLGRTATFDARGASGEDDEEGIGRRQLTSGEMRLRAEERKRYQFEATESDDEIEDEVDAEPIMVDDHDHAENDQPRYVVQFSFVAACIVNYHS